MRTAKLQEVIVTDLTVRGDRFSDPMRTITQYWDKTGELLAEVDPWEPRFKLERIQLAAELQAKLKTLQAEIEAAEKADLDTRREWAKDQASLTAANLRIAYLEKLKKEAEQRFAGLQDAALKKLGKTRRNR